MLGTTNATLLKQIHNKFGTPYEIKCDETFAFYDGYIYDYDEDENRLKASFGWKKEQLVPISYIRPIAPSIDSQWKPKQGDRIEVECKYIKSIKS